jgi:hypothetical protein
MVTRIVFVILAALLVAPAVTSVIRAQPSDTSAESTELEQLRQRIDKLEERVKQLEQQPRVQITQPSPPYGPTPRRIPDNWEQREFNGMPFYIIPCDNEANATVPPKRD